MNHITARGLDFSQSDELSRKFGIIPGGGCDAAYFDMKSKRLLGSVGLLYDAPICNRLMNNPEVSVFLSGFDSDCLFSFGENNVRFKADGKDIPLPENVRATVMEVYRRVINSAGTLGGEGEHIIDLKSDKTGTHFDVNLLIGNRIGFENPLLTTPKGSLDSLGRGSFRGVSARQVTSTRYNLIPEQNGEPANRQLYIIEDGRQIFYSADVETNVESAVCRHACNRSEITYKTNCGLEIIRTIFILPQEEGMPDAVECQRVEIKNHKSRPRELKIVFTGMFGLATPESAMNDIIYASVTWEGGIITKDGTPIAVAPSPYPGYLKPYRRFAMLSRRGEYFDEYTSNYLDFIGNGTLEKPQNVAHLTCLPTMKTAPFFAIAKSLEVCPGKTETVCEYVGMTIDKSGERAEKALSALAEKYRTAEACEEALSKVKAFADRYAGFLSVKTENPVFDSYINHNLPFQVYYQSYVSRSFAWTQKAFREIGFREIQDMFASLYYITGMGENTLARDMLGMWISNVYEMGYANHNFYESGKEPGICSDDGLWLPQAIYRYISLTGDVDFLFAEYQIAGSDKKRTVLDTLLAIVMYSGKISVGAHGLPLLDRGDWNDCLKLDDDWIDGPEKEKRYRAQLAESGKPYGVRFESEYSESVMNAFLLKIAYDDICELARRAGKPALADEMKSEAETLSKRIQEHAWKGDFFARALVGGCREGGYTYLGAHGDGLSLDSSIDGTYYLNSFTWSVLAGVAGEEQILTMLGVIEKQLVTSAGIKLCTPANLGALAHGTSASVYFPGDRENGGVFKHAAMMASAALLKAAKTVKSEELSRKLSSLAFFATDTVYPYKTLLHPFKTKGNPRFCTQYNNSKTGENIGPMLSGTASWLTLTVIEMLGICFEGDNIRFSPILPGDMLDISYTLKIGGAEISVHVTNENGRIRTGEGTEYFIDGKKSDGVCPRPGNGEKHTIEIRI